LLGELEESIQEAGRRDKITSPTWVLPDKDFVAFKTEIRRQTNCLTTPIEKKLAVRGMATSPMVYIIAYAYKKRMIGGGIMAISESIKNQRFAWLRAGTLRLLKNSL